MVLVMMSAREERIPLHSFATSMAIPGSSNTMPSRKTGIPMILKMTYVKWAEPTCNALISGSSSRVGIGIIKIRNKSSEGIEECHEEKKFLFFLERYV